MKKLTKQEELEQEQKMKEIYEQIGSWDVYRVYTKNAWHTEWIESFSYKDEEKAKQMVKELNKNNQDKRFKYEYDLTL